MRKQLDTTGHDFSIWRVDSNSSGAARYVVHYLAIPYEDDEGQPFWINQSNHFSHARDMLHGRKYRANWFGGGIVFQSYAGDPVKDVLAAIRRSGTGESFVTAYNAL